MTVEELAAMGTVPGSDEQTFVVDLDHAAKAPTAVVDAAAMTARRHPGVVLGVASAPLSRAAGVLVAALTTTVSRVDGGPATVTVADPDAAAARLRAGVEVAPHASRVLAQVLRLAGSVSVTRGLWAESLAYSALLGGHAFRQWRASTPLGDRTPSVDAVRIERRGDVLDVRLSRAERRNALDAAARAALSAALDIAIADPSLRVELSGEGPTFCSGGDLDEFGTATDLALAHTLRIARGPAPRMHAVAERTTVQVHGACVGAGVELPAFAGRVVAAPGTTFRLPELGMGLIPGAGGTVSLTRRAGRWRTAWLALTGEVIDVHRAVAWGLVDDVA